MKELDFDELDKAVNSLMGGKKSSNQPASPANSDEEPTVTITPTLKQNDRPDFGKLNEQIAENTSVDNSAAKERPAQMQPSRSLSPAARRGGRFMDVMHPSTTKPADAKKVSREGVNIQPATTGQNSQPVVSSEPSVKPISTASAEQSTQIANETTSQESSAAIHSQVGEWPDPIDMHTARSENKAITQDQDTSPQSTSYDAAPLTSPFLADTKVEKRPLGSMTPAEPSFSGSDMENADDKAEYSASNGDSTAQLPAQPSDVQAPLPEELHGELMAIESGNRELMPIENKQKITEVTALEPAEEPPVDATRDNVTTAEAHDDDASQEAEKPLVDETNEQTEPVYAASENTAQTSPSPYGAREMSASPSIPQQYKEQPSTGDQSSGAIYDTENYHEPLSHPAKKKSGWMWVIWILLILIIGAGGGAAIYFMGMM